MRRLATVAFGVGLACVLLELGLRAGTPFLPAEFALQLRQRGRVSRWVPHPFQPYAGRPNGHFIDGMGSGESRQQIDTNAHGFRTHEFPTHKEPDEFVVLCFGESSTYGFQVASNAATWPALLEKELGRAYPTRRIRVFNFGVDMATTAVSLVNLALVGVHLQPDLILVYQAYNDLSAMGYSELRTDHSHFYRDLTPADLRPSFQERVPDWLFENSQLIAYGTGVLDAAMRPNDLLSLVRRPRRDGPDRLQGLEITLSNLRSMHSIASGIGASIVFSTFQFRDPRGDTSLMNEAYRKLFTESGYAYVDQDRLLPDEDPTINVDECHLTAKGDILLAHNFRDFIVAEGLGPHP